MSTTAVADLERAMAALKITTDITDGPERRVYDRWEHNAYRFRLYVRGEDLGSFPYMAGMGHEPMPAATDLFGAVLMDCVSVEPYANDDAEEERNVWPQTRAAWPPRWEEWAEDMGMLSEPVDR